MRGNGIQQGLSLEKKKDFEAKVSKFFGRSIEMDEKLTKLEERGWDLKFQNYWGHIVASHGHYKKNV